MTSTISLLAFCGSARAQSLNDRLLRGMAERLDSAGARVELVSLRDLALPLYDGDLEEASGVPENAVALRRRIAQHDGLVIAGPEHNGSVSALLKNALDWCSRPIDGLGGLAPFRLKPTLILGTSVSPFGGLRSLGHLRAILGKMGCLVFPDDLAIPNGGQAFSADGNWAVDAHRSAAETLARNFVEFVARTAAPAT